MPKLNLNREPMPRQNPKLRGRNFNEVALGYSPEQAKVEASRCIQCPKYSCVDSCPVEVDIPGFIKAMRDNNMSEAVRILKDKNSLPGICERVCPQETSLRGHGVPVATSMKIDCFAEPALSTTRFFVSLHSVQSFGSE